MKIPGRDPAVFDIWRGPRHYHLDTGYCCRSEGFRGCLVPVTCRSRVICKKVASKSGTIGAQSEN